MSLKKRQLSHEQKARKLPTKLKCLSDAVQVQLPGGGKARIAAPR